MPKDPASTASAWGRCASAETDGDVRRREPGTRAADAADRPATCLVNATVVTGDPEQPRARAVAIAGSRVVAVGTDAEAQAVAGPRARVLDCGGGTVLPGFIDAHVHLLALARSLSSVDLSPGRVASIAGIRAKLRRAADAAAPGAWVRGHGYDEFYLQEGRHPTRRDLDAAVPERPVRLRHRTRHASVLNSAALRYVAERAGDLLRAPGVERVGESGEPTGVLYDLDPVLTRILPRPAPSEILGDLARASDLLLAAGVTAVDDATATNGAEELRLLREARSTGVLKQRLRVLWGMAAHGLPDDPSMTAVKLTLADDGSGVSEFGRALAAAHRRGLQVAVHAVDESAVAVALAAFEDVLRRWPRPHRHRIEHCTLCPPPLLERIGALGLAVVVQPGFLVHVGQRYVAQVPVEQQRWLYPLRSLAAHGVVLAGSSDAPVGPVAPLLGVAAAVSRHAGRGVFVTSEQALPLEAALGLYARGAAYVTCADQVSGALAAGRLADAIVFREDLTRVPVERLGAIAPVLVLIGGDVVQPSVAVRTRETPALHGGGT